MVITRYHLAYYSEIFALAGFFQDPVAVFGFQDFSTKQPGALRALAKDVDTTRMPREEWRKRNEAAGIGVF